MPKMPWFKPSRGEQRADKYNGVVGPNYLQWGEVPGFLYNPGTDEYYLDKRSEAQKRADDLAAKGPPGMLETYGPILGVGAALAGGQALGNKVPDYLSGFGDKITGMFGGGGAEVAKESASTLGSAVTGATEATAGAGSELMSGYGAAESAALDAQLGAAPGIGLAPYLGAAGALLGAHGLYKGLKEGDTKSSALSGAGLGGGLAMAAPLAGFGPLGWGAIGLSALGGGALGAGLSGLFDHESTKEVQQKHWKGLAKGSDPVTSQYAQQYLQHIEQGPSDGPRFGELKKSGQLTPEHVWGGYGMFKTFGSDWLNKYSEDQRRQISKALIDNGLVDQKKGDIVITDTAKAKQIADGITNPKPAAPPAAQPSGMLDPNPPKIDPSKLTAMPRPTFGR